MVGIISYGVYLPRLRMTRDTIAKAWGGDSVGGERAVANYDEDSATMAASAVLDCLDGVPPDSIDGLYFASTTSPYREKLTSTLLAAIADMRKDVATADFCNSLRCATTALRAAVDSLAAGSTKKLLLAASDCRLGAPGSGQEQSFGDGAAAVLLGVENVACTIEGSYSISHEFTDFWRKPDDRYVRAGDPRFVRQYGYESAITDCVAGALQKYNLKPADFARVALYGPDSRSQAAMGKRLGFSKDQLQDTLSQSAGNTGAAQPLLMLAGALEQARPGQLILLTGYGDGADAVILKATDRIAGLQAKYSLASQLANKRTLGNYNKFLKYRGLIREEA